MFTPHQTRVQSHKGSSKVLPRLLAVAALLLASNWVVESEFHVPTAGDVARMEHATHMANFNWAAAISVAHER